MASDDVCGHQNAHYLRMMSERDEARQQVADLRAGIERIRDALTAHIVEYGPMIDAEAPEADLRRLLAGSGERSGVYLCANPDAPDHPPHGMPLHIESWGTCDARPAPAVPDSAGLRGRVARAVVEHSRCEFIVTGETARATCGMPLPDGLPFAATAGDAHVTDAVLALLPGRTEAEVKAEGWDEGLRAGEAFERARWQWSAGATARVVNGLAERPERPANPYRAAVRPSGQEGS